MIPYKNLGGNSGIRGYQIGPDYITVQFSTGRPYTYSYRSAGIDKVETMKHLAEQGHGLNSYIGRFARYSYER